MHRFFISPQAIQGDRAILRGTLVHQIRDVLRMHPGDEFILLDNSGAAYRVELVTLDRDTARARVNDKWKLETEPPVHVTLYQGLLKGQKFDFVLQKGTEIGVSVFVPLLAERCIVGSLDDVSDARVERWDRIIVEAAEQAGRAILPNLMPPMLFAHACDQTPANGLALIPYEGEKSRGLREALAHAPRAKTINLFIGPEGGFTEDEIALAKDKGVLPVSLGPRILRAETAGLVAVSAVLYELGDLG
ncbi:MAG: 16S rRNA (uracil(1498)-N(3))-methyltransferase [Chloroflexi bacterium]|nr:16S rRNA (uracil(1498)-N(3))-methyltransferase [Chloroflexota bacterium]